MGKAKLYGTIAFFIVWAFASAISIDEILGINHVWGLLPITVDSENNLFLFLVILAAGPVFAAWWAIHVYRRKYGDLSK